MHALRPGAAGRLSLRFDSWTSALGGCVDSINFPPPYKVTIRDHRQLYFPLYIALKAGREGGREGGRRAHAGLSLT